mgnify:CR=1 FL=1
MKAKSSQNFCIAMYNHFNSYPHVFKRRYQPIFIFIRKFSLSSSFRARCPDYCSSQWKYAANGKEEQQHRTLKRLDGVCRYPLKDSLFLLQCSARPRGCPYRKIVYIRMTISKYTDGCCVVVQHPQYGEVRVVCWWATRKPFWPSLLVAP